VLALLYWIFRVLVLGKLPPAKPKCLLLTAGYTVNVWKNS